MTETIKSSDVNQSKGFDAFGSMCSSPNKENVGKAEDGTKRRHR